MTYTPMQPSEGIKRIKPIILDEHTEARQTEGNRTQQEAEQSRQGKRKSNLEPKR